ncbi:hypothetical protein ACVGXE_08080, partial [Escherichia coli]
MVGCYFFISESLQSVCFSKFFSPKILSLTPDGNTTNEYMLCAKVIKKTGCPRFFIDIIKLKKKRLVHLAGESARFASRILYDSINVVMPV